MIRVLVVDDNPVVRMGLIGLLELDDRIEVCGEASSGEAALTMARERRPEVVLLDVRMPGGGGLGVLEELCEISKVLMLTYSDEPAVVSEALRRGATGYLVHGAFQVDELAVAIIDTSAGRARLSPAAAAVLVQSLNGGGAGAPAPTATGAEAGEGPELAESMVKRHQLSRREVEICRLLVRGRSNGEIAGELFIEEKTVKNHINRIFSKLDASSRSEAIAICLGTHVPG